MNRFFQSGLILVLALTLAGAVSAAGPAQDECALAGIENPKQLTSFVKKLQDAIKDKNKAAVAGMVNYPMDVVLDGALISIEEESAFIQNYDSILTKEVQASVLSADVNDIFVNRRGAYLNFVEMTVEGNELGLKSINE